MPGPITFLCVCDGCGWFWFVPRNPSLAECPQCKGHTNTWTEQKTEKASEALRKACKVLEVKPLLDLTNEQIELVAEASWPGHGMRDAHDVCTMLDALVEIGILEEP